MGSLKTFGYAPVNGINLYYEVYGEGEVPLVLIHGGGSTIETSFANILPYFVEKHKVIAVELQAHGRTEDRDTPESFEQDADDVAALLKYLNIPKANILGFSNGGTTTLQIAMRHPELVKKIIPVSASVSRDGLFEGFFDGFEGATLSSMPQPLQDGFLKVTPDKARLQRMFERDVERMRNFKDIPEESIRAIKAPTYILANDQDVITREHSVKLSRLISGARLSILPGFHGELLGEVCSAKPGSKLPEITAWLVDDFLKQE